MNSPASSQWTLQSPIKNQLVEVLLQNSPCYIGIKKVTDPLMMVDAIIATVGGDGSLNRISPLGDPEHPEGISVK